jgi:hypothetical protein
VRAALLRAKLLGVRALSTILVAVALARPAAAQILGGPDHPFGPALWLTVGRGDTPAMSMTDNASGGTWRLDRSKPVNLALDWGRTSRSIGLAASQTTYRMRLAAPSCPVCDADVQALQALGTYRRAGTVFGGRMMQVVEFAVGVTQWGKLTGRNGSTPPSISSNTDFTYGASFGLALPVGDNFELSVMYKSLQVRHETLRELQTGAAPSNFIGFNSLWTGGRLRLFQ